MRQYFNIYRYSAFANREVARGYNEIQTFLDIMEGEGVGISKAENLEANKRFQKFFNFCCWMISFSNTFHISNLLLIW